MADYDEKLTIQQGTTAQSIDIFKNDEVVQTMVYYDSKTRQKYYISAVKNGDILADKFKMLVKGEVYANAGILDPYTKVLLHFDETAVKDECGADWIDLGNSTIANSNAKFGKALQLTGSNAIKHPSGIYLGGQNFTIDGWVYMSSSSGNINGSQSVLYSITDKESTGKLSWLYAHRTAGANYITFGLTTQNYPDSWQNTGISVVNQLVHFAYVYNHSESLASLYINGVKRFDVRTSLTRIKVDVEIGHGRNHSYFIGALDEFRISDRIMRWTEKFTPPTKPYTHLFNGNKYPITIPTLEDKTYTGEEIIQTYESDLIEIGGEISGTNVGTYNAIFKLKNPKIYCWK